LPEGEVIKLFQNYGGAATTFYPTLVFLIFLGEVELNLIFGKGDVKA
jgi:hypothetical protein